VKRHLYIYFAFLIAIGVLWFAANSFRDKRFTAIAADLKSDHFDVMWKAKLQTRALIEEFTHSKSNKDLDKLKYILFDAISSSNHPDKFHQLLGILMKFYNREEKKYPFTEDDWVFIQNQFRRYQQMTGVEKFIIHVKTDGTRLVAIRSTNYSLGFSP
jgi:hypothetical protein